MLDYNTLKDLAKMDESLDPVVDFSPLLVEAESWSPQEIEDRLQDLLQVTSSTLISRDRTPEDKMVSMRFLTSKLLHLLPVFEVDESAYCPLLTAVLELLDQLYTVLPNLEDEDEKVAVLTTAVTLMEHAHSVVKHAKQQEGAGPGELPSVPRLVPKILYKSLSECGLERGDGMEVGVREGLDTLMVKSKDALESFCGLMESMKIRSVLEDEMEILLELCSSLVDFHGVLISLDFRSACRCWQLFARLTNEHAVRLRDKLDMNHSIRVLSSQLNKSIYLLVKEPELITGLTSADKAKNANKQVAIAAFLVKVLVKLADHYHGCLDKDMDEFLILLIRLLDGDYKTPDWFSAQLVDKIDRDIFSPLYFSSILRLPNLEILSRLLLTFWDKGDVAKILSSRPFPTVLLAIKILEDMRAKNLEITSIKGKDLLHLIFQLIEYSGKDLIKPPTREGIPIMGNAVVKVDNYEWVLTHLCAWISTASSSEFSLLERQLFLQIQNPSGWSALMTCDVWCFVARYGTSQLCHSHITLLSKMALNLPLQSFTSRNFWIKIIIGRLFNLLAPEEQNSWMEQFSPVEPHNLRLFSLINLSSMKGEVSSNHQLLYDIVHSHVEEFLSGTWKSSNQPLLAGNCLAIATQLYKAGLGEDWLPNAACLVWRKLAEGSFSPSPFYWESQFFSNLVEATCAIVGSQDSTQLIANIRSVLRAGVSTPYLLVGLAKILPCLTREGGPRHGEEALTEIGGLYRSLLSQSARDPHVHMEALGAFSLFAHSTQHEGVLGGCVDTGVSQSVKGFIAKKMEVCGEESDDLCDVIERLYDVKDELSIAVSRETVDAVDDEPRRKVSPSVRHPRTGSPSSKKRKLWDKKDEVSERNKVEDIIKKLSIETDKLLKIVDEDKENKVEGDSEKQIATIISRLQTLVHIQGTQKEEENDLFSQTP